MKYRSGENFTVLAVCTGNICRSPALERLLRAEFADSDRISVVSGGLGALVGEPVHPPMADLLRRRGVDADGFAAQQVTQEMVNSADLVLTASRRQRSAVVEISPAAVRRTFTVRELARIAANLEPRDLDEAAGGSPDPVQRFAALVPLAATHRFEVDRNLDDVSDPYRRSPEAYAVAFTLIDEAVETITRVVRGEGARMAPEVVEATGR
ncbi:low molecular weight phosphatase family protein [Pseudactinotalea sp. Z1748]|uniref:arsenate reductase/protein-tyrosine-phosphatase family protein n=1 Tax=Pseudactinotalea sp. Z1748 TaxID=3413027 RepID=UPI003C7A74EB